jgi:hypothetical protein
MQQDVIVTNDKVIVGLPPMIASTNNTNSVFVEQANTNYYTSGADRSTQCCDCDKNTEALN